jgi:iron complex outermembrane recepter protein
MGGVNLPPSMAGCNVPPESYGPDSLWSYEFGTKNHLFEDRLELDASAFHVGWGNLQQFLATDHANTPCGYIGNTGRAASNGFDLAARALLTNHLKLNFTGAYTDAHYTQTVKVGQVVIVDKGDALGALPMVAAPWHIVTSVEYGFSLGSGPVATAQVEDIFHSRNPGPFTSSNPASLLYAPDRRPDPSTNLLNARINATWANMDMALFVNNVFDSQPTLLLRNRCCTDTLFYATTFRPRTVGLSTTYRF